MGEFRWDFVEATREHVAKFTERRFGETTFAAVFVDGIAFAGDLIVVAREASGDGSTHVLGVIRGETQNTEIVTSLLTNLRDRRLKTNQRGLFCICASLLRYISASEDSPIASQT